MGLLFDLSGEQVEDAFGLTVQGAWRGSHGCHPSAQASV
jgi:hypothetical protein